MSHPEPTPTEEPKVRLTPLDSEKAIELWDTVGTLLNKSLEWQSGRLEPEDLRRGVEEGSILVILVWEPETGGAYAAIGCEMEAYPNGTKVFHVNYLGGHDLFEWAPHIYPGLKFIAATLGANQIEIAGRRGWKRFLPGARESGATFVEAIYGIR